jgi:hypothetical protein
MNDIVKHDCPNECIKQVNKLRLNDPKSWLFIQIECNGQTTLCKSYGTSIQILRKGCINYQTGWDLSVKEWKERILTAIKG